MEIAHPGKWKGNHTPENNRNYTPQNDRKQKILKMPDWKLHTLENARMENAQPLKCQKGNDWKITPRKMTENGQLEFARTENTHPWKCQNGNCKPWKVKEKLSF